MIRLFHRFVMKNKGQVPTPIVLGTFLIPFSIYWGDDTKIGLRYLWANIAYKQLML
jgi:hypothetical protein